MAELASWEIAMPLESPVVEKYRLTANSQKYVPKTRYGENRFLTRMALSTGILRFCDRELPRPRSVEERDPSRS